MLCVRLVGIGIGEMHAFRLVRGPIVAIRVRGVVVETAKFNVLSVG